MDRVHNAARAGLKAINDEADTELEAATAAAHVAAALLCTFKPGQREQATTAFLDELYGVLDLLTQGQKQ